MKINRTEILLPDMRFHAYHGVDPQEQLIGADFIVSLRVATDFRQAMAEDEISATVNYAELHEVVKSEMKIPSKLLEHVGNRILSRLFRDFPAIVSISLELYKENPPILNADLRRAGICIVSARD